MSSTVAPSRAREARIPAPALPPFEALDRTHREVLETLDLLDALVVRLGDAGLDDEARRSAARIHAFFETQARRHHADEERFVFPGLLASGDAELVQHVQRLQQDHGWLEEDWLELAPQLEAIAAGYSWYDLAMLQHALPVFRALYADHIGLEESLIYPEAKRREAVAAAGVLARTA